MKNLPSVIASSVMGKLEEYGTTVENLSQKKTFQALISSSDLSSEFCISDQQLEEKIQGVIMNENAPKTGDVIKIGDKKFIIEAVQTRVQSPISRFFGNLKINK